MRKLSYSLLGLVLCTRTFCQDGALGLGARSSGLAGASVTLSDEYSLHNNVGGIGRLSTHAIFAGYQSRYGISEFQVISGGGLWHHKIGNAGIGYQKFGDDLFNRQQLTLAVGNRFQMVSLGVGIDWIQYQVESIGTRQVLAIQFGGVVELTPQLFLGAHVFNLGQASVVSNTGEQLPTVMKGGLSIRPSDELMINVEAVKDLTFDAQFKAGIEYEIIQNVLVRTGISSAPSIGCLLYTSPSPRD